MNKTLPQQGLHHVGYVVDNLEKTLESMKKTLGDLEYQLYEFKPSKAWCYGKLVENYQLKIAMVSLAGNPTNIEIIQPMTVGMHRDAAAKNSGINHICFAVTGDYDKWRQHFRQAGAQFVFESETEDTVVGYRRCFYIEDEMGNIVEVKETPYFRTGEEK